MDLLAIIELQRWGFPGVTKCRHRSIEFLTTQTDQSKGDILIDYVLKIVLLSLKCKKVVPSEGLHFILFIRSTFFHQSKVWRLMDTLFPSLRFTIPQELFNYEDNANCKNLFIKLENYVLDIQ